jgi:hypothetical protein
VKSVQLLALFLFASLAHADCPDGVRKTAPAEKQRYLAAKEALLSGLPPVPAGWERDERSINQMRNFAAPDSVCKGGSLAFGYSVTYTSIELRQQHQRVREEETQRQREISAFSPEDQKAFDEAGFAGRQLERQALVEERKNNNPAEAQRLRAEAKVLFEKSKAIKDAHRAATLPKLMELSKETSGKIAALGMPTIVMSVLAHEGEKLSKQIEIGGVPGHFEGGDKTPNGALILTIGNLSVEGRPVLRVKLEGSRREVLAIAESVVAGFKSLTK